MVEFPCVHCGKCCLKLGKGDWTGLSLFSWETHFFPEDSVKPSLGLGITPDDPDFKVILYLYDDQTCIHLEDDHCQIHDQRPIICRSYPFRMSVQGKNNRVYEIAPECTAIKEWPMKTTSSKRYKEMNAADFIGEHLHRFYTSDSPKWRFSEGKWVQIGKG